MSRRDLWSDCCEFLEKEGWGNANRIKFENPEEYKFVTELFRTLRKKFQNSPDSFKGSGMVEGIGMFPSGKGAFLVMHGMSTVYEPGSIPRRYIIAKAIKDFMDDISIGSRRKWAEIDNLSNELLIIPKSELLRQEKAQRPDGAGSAVSRAGARFQSNVRKKWEKVTGISSWEIGILQFFLWKQGRVAKDESNLAKQTYDALDKNFLQAFPEAIEELKHYGLPNRKEWLGWLIRWQKDLNQELDANPRLLPLLLPLMNPNLFPSEDESSPEIRKHKKPITPSE
jgi:hypothetical protein